VFILILNIFQVKSLVNLFDLSKMESHSAPKKKTLESAWPRHVTGSLSQLSATKLAPIIISSQKPNVKLASLTHSETKNLGSALRAAVGEIKDFKNMPGGDWLVHPTDTEQQTKLLELTVLADHPVCCSFPKSASESEGIIAGVSESFTEEELLEELAPQGVSRVKRLMRKEKDTSHFTGRVLLIFKLNKLPSRVVLAGLVSFPVAQFIPTPRQCKKCWRLQHISCESEQTCENCCKVHDSAYLCNTKCINCRSSEHKASSKSCPAYLEMKEVLKYKAFHKVSVDEAKLKLNATYTSKNASGKNSSSSSSALSSSRPLPAVTAAEFASLKETVTSLQAVVLKLNSETVPRIENVAVEAKDSAAKCVATTAEIKKKISSVLTKFQKDQADSQKSFLAEQQKNKVKLDKAMEAMFVFLGTGEQDIPDECKNLVAPEIAEAMDDSGVSEQPSVNNTPSPPPSLRTFSTPFSSPALSDEEGMEEEDGRPFTLVNAQKKKIEKLKGNVFISLSQTSPHRTKIKATLNSSSE